MGYRKAGSYIIKTFGFSVVLILNLASNISINGRIVRSTFFKYAEFTCKYPDLYLKGNVLKRYYHIGNTECQLRCLLNPKCKSLNFHTDGICELNGLSARDVQRHDTTSVSSSKEGWMVMSTDYAQRKLGPRCKAEDPCGVFDLCIDRIDNCQKNHICLSNVFYTSPTQMKEFEEHCIFRPPTYYGLGCYKANGRNHTVFRKLVYNLRATLNWLKMSETVEKCATLLANYHGSNPPQYFAIRFYGECWTNDNSDDLRYDIFGKAYNCYMGTGGSSSNYVYQLASNAVNVTELASRSIQPRDQYEEPPAYYGLGCYKANSHRFQGMVGNLVPSIDWQNMTKTVHACARRVWNIWDNISYKYFAIRKYGECYCEDITIASHYYDDEIATDCFMGTGSHVSNYIYYFGPSSEKTATMTYTALGCYGLVPQINHVIATYDLPRDPTVSSDKIKIIDLCAKEAWKRGNKFFGINNDVRCVSGPSTYLPAGLTMVSEVSDACLDGLGRNGTTYVYKFND